MMKSVDARNLLDNVRKQAPERWPAAIQTVAVAAIEGTEELQAKFDKLTQVVALLHNEIKTLRGGKAAAAPAATAAPAADAPAAASVEPVAAAPAEVDEPTTGMPGDIVNGVRIGADGTPMSEDQLALEAQMDSAVTGAPSKRPRAMRAAQ